MDGLSLRSTSNLCNLSCPIKENVVQCLAFEFIEAAKSGNINPTGEFLTRKKCERYNRDDLGLSCLRCPFEGRAFFLLNRALDQIKSDEALMEDLVFGTGVVNNWTSSEDGRLGRLTDLMKAEIYWTNLANGDRTPSIYDPVGCAEIYGLSDTQKKIKAVAKRMGTENFIGSLREQWLTIYGVGKKRRGYIPS